MSLDGLHDAYTGAPLDPGRGLHRCQACQAYYHHDSYAVLQELNEGRCVACLRVALVSVGPVSSGTAVPAGQDHSSAFPAGRDHAVDVVTLRNYRTHVGKVITFEGKVHFVRAGGDPRDLGIMFERTSWERGLKMVVFRGNVAAVGGRDYLVGLTDHTVRVRGLLEKHKVQGYQIVVSERGMILSVK